MAHKLRRPLTILMFLVVLTVLPAVVLILLYLFAPPEIEHSKVVDCVIEEVKIFGGKKSEMQLAQDICSCSGTIYFTPTDVHVTKSKSRTVVKVEYERPIKVLGITLLVRHFSVDESRPVF